MSRSWLLDFSQSRRNPVTGIQDGAELPHGATNARQGTGNTYILPTDVPNVAGSCHAHAKRTRVEHLPAQHSIGAVMRGTRVQYRDSPYGEWKPSYAAHDFVTTEWFNRACGYVKYRWV